MKKWYLGLFLVILIATGIFLFSRLGGFNPVQLELDSLGIIELKGLYYRGTPQDDKLVENFRRIENLKASAPDAALYTIFLVEPAGKLDTMEVFVGLESKFLPTESDLTLKNIPADKAIVASIRSHRFVMPGPNKVKSKIESFARDNNLKLPTLYIDKIIGPNEVQVIAPIED